MHIRCCILFTLVGVNSVASTAEVQEARGDLASSERQSLSVRDRMNNKWGWGWVLLLTDPLRWEVAFCQAASTVSTAGSFPLAEKTTFREAEKAPNSYGQCLSYPSYWCHTCVSWFFLLACGYLWCRGRSLAHSEGLKDSCNAEVKEATAGQQMQQCQRPELELRHGLALSRFTQIWVLAQTLHRLVVVVSWYVFYDSFCNSPREEREHKNGRTNIFLSCSQILWVKKQSSVCLIRKASLLLLFFFFNFFFPP